MVLLLASAATPARAIDSAEVELTGYSVSRTGASSNFGFPVDSPELVFSNDTETPLGPHGDHADAAFQRDRLYRDDERVNTSRSFGGNGPARGTIEPGHSISVSTGYADAGSNELGGWAEAVVGANGRADASGTGSMQIEKRITILPGESGLAAGELVTGLRWVLDGDGFLEVGGRSFPNLGGASAAVSFDVLMLRGPSGTCGAFDCPNGALAISLDFAANLSVNATDPANDGRTARVTRHDTWTASNNTGVYKAGGVFDSGTRDVEIGLVITVEDVAIARADGVSTGAPPLGLDAIEFEANVGETLRITMDLDVYASVSGLGYAESDFFGSFDGHVEDPLGRGLVFRSSVPVPEPGIEASGALAFALLALSGIRRARIHPARSRLTAATARAPGST